jgi:mannosyl-3-phosphoglycerate phosphatase
MSRDKLNTSVGRALKSSTTSKPNSGSSQEQPAIILFTDLDGTLLDSTSYSFEPARPALNLLKALAIPLIICSSKTRLEIERYRGELSNSHPFVAESGGAIFIPKGYFPFEVLSQGVRTGARGDYEVVLLGAEYPRLRLAMEQLRREGFSVRGFGDMTAPEVAKMTGLTLEEAAMAKERDFDEPFILEKAADFEILRERIVRLGFRLTKGAFYHISGESDKGEAVSILSGLYQRALGSIITIGLGDSPNDFSMLECVDYPVLVQKSDGRHDPAVSLPNLMRAEGIGPFGWNEAVITLLRQITLK